MCKAEKSLKSQNYYCEKQENSGENSVSVSKTYYKDGKYNFLATDIQGTVYYDIFQMTPASDCGDYTVIYFSTEVAEWA